MELTENMRDVLIIGAGAAGLIAALELALAGKSCAIVEARDRAGGRIHTINDARFKLPVEAGAEFIHGKLKDHTGTAEKSTNSMVPNERSGMEKRRRPMEKRG
jgi:monoamine oxidase